MLALQKGACLHYNTFIFHFHSAFIQWQPSLLSASNNFFIWLVRTETLQGPQCDNVDYIHQCLSNGRKMMCLHFSNLLSILPPFPFLIISCSSNENSFPSFVLCLYLCWLKFWLACVCSSASRLFITLMVFQPCLALFAFITQRGQALPPTLPTFSRNQTILFQVYL